MVFPPLTWRKIPRSRTRHAAHHLISTSLDDELRALSQIADDEAERFSVVLGDDHAPLESAFFLQVVAFPDDNLAGQGNPAERGHDLKLTRLNRLAAEIRKLYLEDPALTFIQDLFP